VTRLAVRYMLSIKKAY